MTVEKWSAAAITTLASTELNSLASAAGALGVEYDNATNGYPFGVFELTVTFGSAPTAGKTVESLPDSCHGWYELQHDCNGSEWLCSINVIRRFVPVAGRDDIAAAERGWHWCAWNVVPATDEVQGVHLKYVWRGIPCQW